MQSACSCIMYSLTLSFAMECRSATALRREPIRCRPSPSHSKEGKRLETAKRIREVMTSNPRTIEANRPVTEAACLMRDEDVGIAPVVEGDRLVGTVTDRDIVLRVVAEGKDSQSTTVSEIASSDLVTVDPQHSLDEAVQLMTD